MSSFNAFWHAYTLVKPKLLQNLNVEYDPRMFLLFLSCLPMTSSGGNHLFFFHHGLVILRLYVNEVMYMDPCLFYSTWCFCDSFAFLCKTFCGWIILYYMNMCVSSFSYWWMPGLFKPFGYCNWSLCEHCWVSLFVDIYFW